MKSVSHIRLSVFLLDSAHRIKGAAQAEGQPRHAIRRAMEQAVRLVAQNANVEDGRLVIIPSGSGAMAQVCERAKAMSQAGQCITSLEPEEVHRLGKAAALIAWVGRLSEAERVARAKPVRAQVLAA